MFIELAEALDCPVCRQGFGLVAFVRELRDRRVLAGHLGCPQCEAEYPIRSGGIDMGAGAGAGDEARAEATTGARAEAETDPGGEPSDASAGDRAERAMQVAALLGLQERGSGILLLGPGLAGCAGRVVEMGERLEALAILSAGTPLPAAEPPPGVTPIAGVAGRAWPLRARALRGVSLLGAEGSAIAEAERALAADGRLVVLWPAAGVADSIQRGGFDVLAAEARAIVATRRW